MFNTTDIRSLGTTFTITDEGGTPIKTMQVISALEIIDAALGEYDETYENYDDYLEQSIDCLSGFSTDPYRTLWWKCEGASRFATEDVEINIPKAFEYALKYGYNVIVLEEPFFK